MVYIRVSKTEGSKRFLYTWCRHLTNIVIFRFSKDIFISRKVFDNIMFCAAVIFLFRYHFRMLTTGTGQFEWRFKFTNLQKILAWSWSYFYSIYLYWKTPDSMWLNCFLNAARRAAKKSRFLIIFYSFLYEKCLSIWRAPRALGLAKLVTPNTNIDTRALRILAASMWKFSTVRERFSKCMWHFG